MERAAVPHRYPFMREDRIWTCMPRAFATRRSTSWRTTRYVFNCIRNVNLPGNLEGFSRSMTNIANFCRAWQVIWKFEHSEGVEPPYGGFAGHPPYPAWQRVHIILANRDSNPDPVAQNHTCYHYTTGHRSPGRGSRTHKSTLLRRLPMPIRLPRDYPL